jgi:hypothetical protein
MWYDVEIVLCWIDGTKPKSALSDRSMASRWCWMRNSTRNVHSGSSRFFWSDARKLTRTSFHSFRRWLQFLRIYNKNSLSSRANYIRNDNWYCDRICCITDPVEPCWLGNRRFTFNKWIPEFRPAINSLSRSWTVGNGGTSREMTSQRKLLLLARPMVERVRTLLSR